MTYVTPEYFTALRIPMLQGRAFTAVDSVDSGKVCIVNQAFVKRYFKNGDRAGAAPEPWNDRRHCGRRPRISVRLGRLRPVASVPEVYVPAHADGCGSLIHTFIRPSWIVRSTLDGAQVERAIEDATRSADPLLPMAGFAP